MGQAQHICKFSSSLTETMSDDAKPPSAESLADQANKLKKAAKTEERSSVACTQTMENVRKMFNEYKAKGEVEKLIKEMSLEGEGIDPNCDVEAFVKKVCGS